MDSLMITSAVATERVNYTVYRVGECSWRKSSKKHVKIVCGYCDDPSVSQFHIITRVLWYEVEYQLMEAMSFPAPLKPFIKATCSFVMAAPLPMGPNHINYLP